MVIETVGFIASPTIAAAIFDATGSYDLVLAMFAGTFAASIALFYLAARLPFPSIPQPEPVPATP